MRGGCAADSGARHEGADAGWVVDGGDGFPIVSLAHATTFSATLLPSFAFPFHTEVKCSQLAERSAIPSDTAANNNYFPRINKIFILFIFNFNFLSKINK